MTCINRGWMEVMMLQSIEASLDCDNCVVMLLLMTCNTMSQEGEIALKAFLTRHMFLHVVASAWSELRLNP